MTAIYTFCVRHLLFSTRHCLSLHLFLSFCRDTVMNMSLVFLTTTKSGGWVSGSNRTIGLTFTSPGNNSTVSLLLWMVPGTRALTQNTGTTNSLCLTHSWMSWLACLPTERPWRPRADLTLQDWLSTIGSTTCRQLTCVRVNLKRLSWKPSNSLQYKPMLFAVYFGSF